MAEGKRGADLHAALHAIIQSHHVIPYSSSSTNDTSDVLRDLDEDPANAANLLCIYSGKSEPKASFAQTGGWNWKHCSCNSYGLDGVEPAFSDLHNLRPEDSTEWTLVPVSAPCACRRPGHGVQAALHRFRHHGRESAFLP